MDPSNPALDRPSGAPDLRVGDPARPAIGRAVLTTMAVAAAFLAVTWASKELPAVYAREPWRDDPYDAFVSFAIIFVAVLGALCSVRVPLCRRDAPLPRRRALDLLSAGRTLVAIMVVALGAEWASVVDRPADASAATAGVLGGQLLLTALVAAAALALRRAGRAAAWRRDEAPAQPDWLADAVALGERAAGLLGARGAIPRRALRGLDRRVLAIVRRRPAATAAALSVAFGAMLAAGQALVEGYTAATALLVLAVAACGMFAFLVIAGAHLRLAGTAPGRGGRAVPALTVACGSVPAALAFGGTVPVMAVAAATSGGVAYAVLALARR